MVPAGAATAIAIRCGAVETTTDAVCRRPRRDAGEVVVAEPEPPPDLVGVEEPAVVRRGRVGDRQRIRRHRLATRERQHELERHLALGGRPPDLARSVGVADAPAARRRRRR